MSGNSEETLKIGIRGDVGIKEYEIESDENGNPVYNEDGTPKRTGVILGEFEEKNVVLTQGIRLILEAFARSTNSQSCAKTIKIGNDTGSGSLLNPQPAVATLTEANQSVLYETPVEEFFVSYPTQNSVRFLATINGPNVMANYPTLPNIVYTSASLYTMSDKSVTYKRFPARTISSLISVDISWTITLV